jgi:hypothetical protein
MYYRIIEVTIVDFSKVVPGFRPEVLLETIFSQIIRKIFPRKQPTFSWKGIGGFGYTSKNSDMCVCPSLERADLLVKCFANVVPLIKVDDEPKS